MEACGAAFLPNGASGAGAPDAPVCRDGAGDVIIQLNLFTIDLVLRKKYYIYALKRHLFVGNIKEKHKKQIEP